MQLFEGCDFLKVIEVEIKNKKAVRTNEAAYVCDNSDFTVVFSFDEEWDAFSVKTARFVYGDKHQDVVFTGTECPMPKIHDTKLISVGVFAGDLHTTTPASIVANKSILGASTVPDEPSPDVYAQIVELCGETKDIAQSVRDDADNGAFDGEDGYTPIKGKDYFDGKDGYTPQKGKDYFDGKDGVSCTHSWNGTVLTVKSASGESSADLKGKDGYTPKKGVDYYTDEEKEEMVNSVLAEFTDVSEVGQ